MRLITHNLIDSATVTCTNASAALPATNVQKEGKTAVLRTGSGATQINAVWTGGQTIGATVLPWVNLDASATWRVRLYGNAAMTTLLHDSGTVSAGLFAQPVVEGLPDNANAFVYGVYGSAAYWLEIPIEDVFAVRIDITNGDRAWIDIGRWIAGTYWQPRFQCDVGAQVGMQDLSVTDRNQSGDARVRIGARFRVLKCDLSMMPATDRKELWNLVRSHGSARPLFVSVVPVNAVDSDETAMLQVYGKFVNPPALSYAQYNAYSAAMEFEEM